MSINASNASSIPFECKRSLKKRVMIALHKVAFQLIGASLRTFKCPSSVSIGILDMAVLGPSFSAESAHRKCRPRRSSAQTPWPRILL